MQRTEIRRLKRQIRQGAQAAAADTGLRRLAEAAALALLERSVRMRHRRLAVQRLHRAVGLGVEVPEEYWAYCRQAAAGRDAEVRLLFARCEQAVDHRRGG
jgi:hypothetical protein